MNKSKECLHEFNCLDEQQIDNNVMAFTYECNICGEIRIEYQSMETQELLDEYDIIKEGKIIK
jgi:hypothetical protein